MISHARLVLVACLFGIPLQAQQPLWPAALETRLRTYYAAQAKPPVFTPPAGSVAPDPLKLALVHLLQHDVHDAALREALLLDLIGVTPPPPPPEEPPPPPPPTLSIKSDTFDATAAIWSGSYGVAGGVASVSVTPPSSGWGVAEIRQACADEPAFSLTATLSGTAPGAGKASGLGVSTATGWLRVESTNGGVYALFSGGPPLVSKTVAGLDALRIQRAPGNVWTVSYRAGGVWTALAPVTKAMAVTSVGLYAAARGSTYVAKFDSFEVQP